jgi:hypothetical protein
MRCVRVARSRLRAALRIKAPHDLGVFPPALWRGNLLKAVLLPEPTAVAKRADTAFGADPSAGEHEHALSVFDA